MKTKDFSLLLIILALLLSALFFRSCESSQVLFSNDAPLGSIKTDAVAAPQGFSGVWLNLNWLGMNAGSFPPTISYVLMWWLGPLGFAKFYSPITLLILGLCAWIFFKSMRWRSSTALLGALAAMLNMNMFSNVCWGLGTRAVTMGMAFLALAALVSQGHRFSIVKTLLAGAAVGIGIMEGADNGAIFSLYVAAFAIAWAVKDSQPSAKDVWRGVSKIAVVAIFAALVSAHALITLVQTQIEGVSGMAGEERTSEQQWDWATQWSLPKAETLRVIIPGLYGYRVDAPNGGKYWGSVGQTPGWEQHHQGIPRHSGSGEYGGVLVVLVAFWALFQSFGKTGAAFRDDERKLIWFWGGAALVSLMLAWGRHFPLYRVVYALPYFSTIRNPIKFMHPFHMALLILFGYGLEGLGRRYLQAAGQRVGSVTDHLKAWWHKSTGPEMRWRFGLLGIIGVGLIGWLIYSTSRTQLVQHLTTVGFNADQAQEIVTFSFHEVGLFVLFLTLSVGALILIMSGFFTGARSRLAAVLLGFILVVDLARANTPWIQYENYQEKYASNPVIDVLRDQPYRHRVTAPNWLANAQAPYFPAICNQWLQFLFPYYNIQSLDVVQMPREPVDYVQYRQKTFGISREHWQEDLQKQPRLWELTNTRYILGMTGYLSSLNQLAQAFGEGPNAFRIHTAFNFAQGPNETIQVVTNASAPFALFEYPHALPRAKLYAQWEVNTNDDETLSQLASPAFDPHQRVIVANPIQPPPPESAPSTNQNSIVEFVSYAPKRVELRSEAAQPTVLLLNDKYDPNWRAWVDGQPVGLLRCNYIMRGVNLPPGSHTILFRFQAPLTGLYVSLAAMGVAALMVGILVFGPKRNEPAPSRPPAGKPPAASK